MTMSNAKVPVVGWYYRLHEVTGYSGRSSQKNLSLDSVLVPHSNSQRATQVTKFAVASFAESQGTTP